MVDEFSSMFINFPDFLKDLISMLGPRSSEKARDCPESAESWLKGAVASYYDRG
jgi:hypothetical protein